MNLANRPRMIISNVSESHIENITQEIQNSESVLAFYKAQNGRYSFLHTGLNEEDYATVLILFSRHIQLFDFFKLAIINTEKYRKEDGKEGVEFGVKALEYMQWKKQNFNQIKTNDLI